MFNPVLSSFNLREKLTRKTVFAMYCLSLGFILIMEASMGYYFPIVLDKTFNSNLLTGAVIGFANLAALLCDFLIPELFKKRSWKFLLLAAVLIQIGYPTFIQAGLAFNITFFLIMAALFWNVYFEFLAFSRQNFIITNEKPEDYSRDWSLISVVISFTAIIGPIIGSQLASADLANSSWILAVIESLAVVSVLLLLFITPQKEDQQAQETQLTSVHHRHRRWSILKEFRLWEVLGTRILPVLFLGILVTINGAAIVTVGGLLGEQLLGQQKLDWLLVFMTSVPAIFVSMFLARVRIQHFKKLLSQISMVISGLSLILLPFVKDYPVVVIALFFCSSLFSAIAWIFNEAVYSDLSRRSGEEKLYINSMERINDSVGFLIGPILIGFLADRVGYFTAFEILGAITIVVAFILILVTPHKIIIPHQELEDLQTARN